MGFGASLFIAIRIVFEVHVIGGKKGRDKRALIDESKSSQRISRCNSQYLGMSKPGYDPHTRYRCDSHLAKPCGFSTS